MRNQRTKRNTPTVIIQQAPAVGVIERQPVVNQQSFMMQLAQMMAEQQAKKEAEVRTFDVKEAAEFLRMSPWSVRDMVRTKSIPFFRIRSRIFFRRHDLEKWISNSVNDCGGK